MIIEREKLYSTGDYELDDLLEKAFCDGYEYAQREFSGELVPVESAAEDVVEKVKNKNGFISKNLGRVKRLYTGKSKFGRTGQIAAIGTTALGAAGIGYGAYKHHKNKNQQGQEQ